MPVRTWRRVTWGGSKAIGKSPELSVSPYIQNSEYKSGGLALDQFRHKSPQKVVRREFRVI
jgi:hypothetical protein